MRIYSWNVNGIRACARKGFIQWLQGSEGDIVAVQEVRALEEQMDDDVRTPDGWHTHFSAAERKGYSGVGLYSKPEIDHVQTSLGEDRFDLEGRVQIATFGGLTLVNGYFPNGSGKNRDNSRIPYKLDFYRAVFDALEPAKAAGAKILVLGDFNTAHREIDLARPKSNTKTSGFCPEERAELDRWLDAGWVDTFRDRAPQQEGAYTWWSQRFGVRERNVGWRIDYVLASPGAMPFIEDAFIHPDVKGSDHCPIGVDVRPEILAP